MKLVGQSRRLPIYLVADTSTSMQGPAIEAVNAGLRSFAAALRLDAHALECAAITVITFADEAHQLMPLVEAGAFVPPTLAADGNTALGKALGLLAQCLDSDTRLRTESYAGDWRPMIFLMTDGAPTDDWRKSLPAYRVTAKKWKSSMIAIGCGPKIDLAVLSELAPQVMLMPDMTPDTIASLFEWISQSVQIVSQAVSRSSDQGERAAELPLQPKGFVIHQG